MKYDQFFKILIACIISIGITSSLYVYHVVSKSEKQSLLARAQTIATLVTSKDLNNIDLLKIKFASIVEANPDMRFVYILGQKDNKVFFIVDSEDKNSPDYSPYGQVYDEATPVLKSSFTDGVARLEFASDRWGSWFSAFAPIIEDSKVVALVGIDITIQHYATTIIAYTLIPLAIALLLTTFVMTGLRLHRKEEETITLKTNFITHASHELRSPLSGIRWASELLLNEKVFFTKEQQNTIETIHTASVRILRIVKDLLQVSSIDSKIHIKSFFSECDVLPTLRNSVEELLLTAKSKGVSITVTEHVPDRILTFGDEQQLKQVFANLLSNAIKYSRENSTVLIQYIKENNMHTISWVDQGIGIPKDEYTKIMQGFYRAKNARSMTNDGTGLGLYIVKKIIDLHQGNFTFTSQEGKGSTFFVQLPISK